MKNNCYINVKVLFENVRVRVHVRSYLPFPTTQMTGLLENKLGTPWHFTEISGTIYIMKKKTSSSQYYSRATLPTLQCTLCSRTFHMELDMARHKCIEERLKPVHQQQSDLRCSNCGRWFKSKDVLAVHNCHETNCNITEHH